jgi:GT2 family glycosyltransferase
MPPSPKKKTIAVVILNWNGRHFLETFLPSVFRSTYPAVKVYVADNGSTDDSIYFLKAHYPTVTRIDLGKNHGFAGGYNLAIQSVEEEIMVLLNSDIEVSPTWIEPVMELFEQDEKIAAIQPKLLDFNNRTHFEYAGAAGGWIDRFGYPFSRGRLFDEIEEDKKQYDSPQPIFWASGASLFIRKKDFLQVGGFDPYFFAHQEEIDLCWRLQLAGHKIMSCPSSVVYHIGGGTLSKDNPKKVFLNFRNNLIMLWKNLEGLEAAWILLCRFGLDALSAWKNLLSGQPSYFVAVARSHFAFVGWLLSSKKNNVFPATRGGMLSGYYRGSIVWQHFVLEKKRFSEIIVDEN